MPELERVLEAEGSNQFVCLLTRARLMAKKAELALFVSQAEGQLADADLKRAFLSLDTNHANQQLQLRGCAIEIAAHKFKQVVARLEDVARLRALHQFSAGHFTTCCYGKYQ